MTLSRHSLITLSCCENGRVDKSERAMRGLFYRKSSPNHEAHANIGTNALLKTLGASKVSSEGHIALVFSVRMTHTPRQELPLMCGSGCIAKGNFLLAIPEVSSQIIYRHFFEAGGGVNGSEVILRKECSGIR